MLSRGIDTGMDIDRQPVSGIGHVFRPDSKAELPACHRVGFRPAIENDQPVSDFRKGEQACHFQPVKDEPVINLIAHQRDMGMIGKAVYKFFDFSPRRHPAGGIGGELMMISRVFGVMRRAHPRRKSEIIFLTQGVRAGLRRWNAQPR